MTPINTISQSTLKELWRRIKPSHSKITIKKGESLGNSEFSSEIIVMVEKGTIASVIEHQDGGNNYIDIATEGGIIVQPRFLDKDRHEQSKLVAFEDTILEYLTREEHLKAVQQNQKAENASRMLFENLYIQKKRLLMALSYLDSKGKLKFLKNHLGIIVSRVPAKYIASFIGVTPETLSRLLNSNQL